MKPLKQNFKKTKLKYISPAGNFYNPHEEEKLSKHLQYDIFAGEKFLSVLLDDENICPMLHPDNPAGAYFQTELVEGSSCFRASIELVENEEAKVFTVRNVADVLNRDIVSIHFSNNAVEVIHTDEKCEEVLYLADWDCESGELLDISVSVSKDCIEVVLGEDKIAINEGIEGYYWFNVGLVNSPVKTYNNLRIFRMSLEKEEEEEV